METTSPIHFRKSSFFYVVFLYFFNMNINKELWKIGTVRRKEQCFSIRPLGSTLASFASDILFSASFFSLAKTDVLIKPYTNCVDQKQQQQPNKQIDKRINKYIGSISLLLLVFYSARFYLYLFHKLLTGSHFIRLCVFFCTILHHGIMRMAKAPCL